MGMGQWMIVVITLISGAHANNQSFLIYGIFNGTVLIRIQRMIQGNIRNLIPGIFMNLI